jgi:hypothetical protein
MHDVLIDIRKRATPPKSVAKAWCIADKKFPEIYQKYSLQYHMMQGCFNRSEPERMGLSGE